MASDDAPSQKQIDHLLQRLERRIEMLKKQYRRYFLGIDNRPPMQLRKQVVREVFELEQLFISNTAQKFRLRSLVQSFNTHKTRWNRIMRQIEEGTYKRDRHKAKRRQREREQKEKAQESQQAFELSDDDFIDDLQEIDLDSVFEQPSGREPIMPDRQASAPSQAQPSQAQPQQAARPAADKEKIKQQRLAEIQRKLGLGNDAAASSASPKKAPAQPSSAPGKKQPAASSTRQQKLAAMRRKLNRDQGSQGGGQRSDSGPQRPTTGAHRQVARQAKQSPPREKSTRNSKLDRIRRKLEKEESAKSKSRNASSTGSQRRVVRRSKSKTDDT